jgi:hypothetical protein
MISRIYHDLIDGHPVHAARPSKADDIEPVTPRTGEALT